MYKHLHNKKAVHYFMGNGFFITFAVRNEIKENGILQVIWQHTARLLSVNYGAKRLTPDNSR